MLSYSMHNLKKIHLLLIFITAFLSGFIINAWANPDKDLEITIAKSVYLIDSGNYEEAIGTLKNALNIRPSEKRILLCLGIAHSRAGQFTEAIHYLQNLLEVEPANCRARYELGIAFLELKDIDDAGRYFRDVSETCPDETLKEAANSYIEYIITLKTSESKRVNLNFITGLQHDSNVILESSNPFIKKPKKADWRNIYIFDSVLGLFGKETFWIKAEYMFYQSLHKSLTDFNIHQHSLTLKFNKDLNQNVDSFLHYTIQYSLVGGELYSVINGISPGIDIPMSHNMTSSLSYRHDFRKFFDSDSFSVNSLRSGDIDAIKISQTITPWKNISIAGSYSIERDRTNVDYLDSITHIASVNLGSDIRNWQLYLKAEYYYRIYRKAEPGFSEKRREGRQEYSINIAKDITKNISIYASEIYILNNSNISVYDYSRNIIGLFIMVKL